MSFLYETSLHFISGDLILLPWNLTSTGESPVEIGDLTSVLPECQFIHVATGIGPPQP